MARQSREAALTQAKAAKQKKLLFVLVPVFLGLAVWQGPKTLKAFTGGNSAAPPPAATLPAPTTPAATTPTATLPESGSGLNETDPLIDPLEGQLVSFSSFESKDPFAGLGDVGAPPTSTTPDGTTTTDGSEAPQLPDGFSEEFANNRRVARFAINGVSEGVVRAATFPESEPIFRLVAVERGYVRVGLVEGSFSSGADTVRIDVGESFVFVRETDGARFEVTLVAVRVPD